MSISDKELGDRIVKEMIKGYGPNFPSLEEIFDVQLTEEDVKRYGAPIPGLGRYYKSTAFLEDVTSTKALDLKRYGVIIQYFFALNLQLKDYNGPYRKVVGELSRKDITVISKIGTRMEEIKMGDIFESYTDHDTAARVDYVKLRIAHLLPHLRHCIEGVYLGLTSEDIMGNVFGLIATDLVYNHFMTSLLDFCKNTVMYLIGHEKKMLVLPAQTHLQSAEPTTFGIVFTTRLLRIIELISELIINEERFRPFSGKFGGAVGNYANLYAVYPGINWHTFGREFVENLGLYYEEMPDQSVSYVNEAQIFLTINNILEQIIKLCQDFRLMVSCPGQLFVKRHIKGRKASSVMPGKTNLWAIEGALMMLMEVQNNLSFFSTMLQKFAREGDMGRSYLFRNIGGYFMPAFIAFNRIKREMNNCIPNLGKIKSFLNEYPAMSASSMQNVMKREGVMGDAYRILQTISLNDDGSYANASQYKEGLEREMERLNMPENTRQELRSLLDFEKLVAPEHKNALVNLAGIRIQLDYFKACQAKTLASCPLL